MCGMCLHFHESRERKTNTNYILLKIIMHLQSDALSKSGCGCGFEVCKHTILDSYNRTSYHIIVRVIA